MELLHQVSRTSTSWVVFQAHGRRGPCVGACYQEGWGAEQGYPCIVLDAAAGRVEGFLLTSEALTNEWKRLDEFEGDQYERVLAQIELDCGQVVQAFIYQLKR